MRMSPNKSASTLSLEVRLDTPCAKHAWRRARRGYETLDSRGKKHVGPGDHESAIAACSGQSHSVGIWDRCIAVVGRQGNLRSTNPSGERVPRLTNPLAVPVWSGFAPVHTKGCMPIMSPNRRSASKRAVISVSSRNALSSLSYTWIAVSPSFQRTAVSGIGGTRKPTGVLGNRASSACAKAWPHATKEAA